MGSSKGKCIQDIHITAPTFVEKIHDYDIQQKEPLDKHSFPVVKQTEQVKYLSQVGYNRHTEEDIRTERVKREKREKRNIRDAGRDRGDARRDQGDREGLNSDPKLTEEMEELFSDRLINYKLGRVFSYFEQNLKNTLILTEKDPITIVKCGMITTREPEEEMNLSKLFSLIMKSIKSPETIELVKLIIQLVTTFIHNDQTEFSRIFGLFGESMLASLQSQQTKDLLSALLQVILNAVKSYNEQDKTGFFTTLVSMIGIGDKSDAPQKTDTPKKTMFKRSPDKSMLKRSPDKSALKRSPTVDGKDEVVPEKTFKIVSHSMETMDVMTAFNETLVDDMVNCSLRSFFLG